MQRRSVKQWTTQAYKNYSECPVMRVILNDETKKPETEHSEHTIQSEFMTGTEPQDNKENLLANNKAIE